MCLDVLLKAYAKINWTLNVTGVRPNGYHDLDMIMQSVDLCDDVYMQPAENLTLEIDGPRAAGLYANDDNIMLRAARLMQCVTGCTRGTAMRLTKRIPMQAGMGGGSSDAAVVLKGLNQMWNLGMSDEKLCELGLKLGADVPYCLNGGLCRAQGLGEELTEIADAPKVSLLVSMPTKGLRTAEVFKSCHATGMQPTHDAIESLKASNWNWLRDNTANDLEQPAISMRPDINACIMRMYALGACFARMTGSGSAVYGVCEQKTISDALSELQRDYSDSLIAHTLA